MSNKSKIEWTDTTWNVVTGCTKVSQGCKHCYAERMAKRLAGRNGYPAAPHQFDVTLHPDKLEEPLHWKQPRRVFVNSMSDLFHEKVPIKFVVDVFAVMAFCREHTFQILTKRPERMKQILSDDGFQDLVDETMNRRAAENGWCICETETWPLPNVWLGTSIEDQDTADRRTVHLLQTPAAIRFVSAEPLLGPIDLSRYLQCEIYAGPELEWRPGTILPSPDYPKPKSARIRPPLDWIIAGGESGPDARPMHPDWVRYLRDQCQAAQVPFFFKQWGAWGPMAQNGQGSIHESVTLQCVGKKMAGSILDGREWKEYPATCAVPE